MRSRQCVVIDSFDDPVTLDPHLAVETGSQHAVINVYDGLLGFGPDRALIPVLAAELPKNLEYDGEHRLLIPIRSGVRFHDGAAMTARDVVYSLRRVAVTAALPAALWADALLGKPLPLTAQTAADIVSRITECADGVLLRLARPYAPLPALMVQWSAVVSMAWCVDRGEWDGEPGSLAHHLLPECTALDEECNGTGLYRLASWDRDVRELRYEKVPRTFLGPEAGPQVVVLRAVDDSDQRECHLADDDSDFSVCLTESRDRLSRVDGVVVERVQEARSVNPLAFITQHLDPGCPAVGSGRFGPDGLPPDAFSDLHLRRAVCLCFDHRRYEREVLYGQAVPHTLPFPDTLIPGLEAAWPTTDLDRAREEFAAAWSGQVARDGCRIVIYTHDTNVSRVRAAAQLAENLRQVSPAIVVEVVPVDIGTLVTMLFRGQCPIAWTGWVSDFMHPYSLVSSLLDPRAPLPTALGIRDPMLQHLVEQARAHPSAEEAGPYRAIHEYVRDNALFLAPATKIDFMMYRDRWRTIGMKNQIPHVLDFASFVPRQDRNR